MARISSTSPNSSSSSSKSKAELVAAKWVRSPIFLRTVVIASIVAYVALCHWSRHDSSSSSMKLAAAAWEDESYHKWIERQTNPLQRCYDSDDPPEWMPAVADSPKTAACLCEDPAYPARRNMKLADTHHKELVKAAKTAAASSARVVPLDFVLLGDSITERWRGTRRMGDDPLPDHKRLFQEYFDKTAVKQATLQGLALGSAGDRSNNLLWHLQNGMLPDKLEPKVWVILIGTNDLGQNCSKRNTLAGVLHAAEYLHSQRPAAPILIHGLMPRSDRYHADPTDYQLGKKWLQIQWINRELKRFTKLHPDEWYYIDAAKLFLKKKTTTNEEDMKGAYEIDPDRMTDALHPSLEGYQVWAPFLQKEITAVIRKRYGGDSDKDDENENEHDIEDEDTSNAS